MIRQKKVIKKLGSHLYVVRGGTRKCPIFTCHNCMATVERDAHLLSSKPCKIKTMEME
jgi:hypothetical protein